MKTGLLVFSLILLALAGCSRVEIMNHNKPDLVVDFSPFEDIGCPLDDYGFRICQETSPLYALGCDFLKPVPDLFGGLDPLYPIAKCVYRPMIHPELVDPYSTPDSEFFYNSGGPLQDLVRYVIYRDGEFLLIRNPDEFRETFAPVESANEALSFTLAFYNYSVYFGLQKESGIKYYVDSIEDTHVENTTDGFTVNVFYYQFFGCGPHYTYALEMDVSKDGMVDEISRQKIFSDPSKDDLCQD